MLLGVLWAWLGWQVVCGLTIGILVAYENKLKKEPSDRVLTALTTIALIPLSFGVVVAIGAGKVTEWFLRPQVVARGLRRAKR